MAEYKDVESIMQAINKESEECYKTRPHLGNDYGTGYYNGLSMALAIILKTPLAEVEPVRHGHWIGSTDAPDLLPKYCPDCGAKMSTQ